MKDIQELHMVLYHGSAIEAIVELQNVLYHQIGLKNISNEVKYLGLIQDRKLIWRNHIQERTNKALRCWAKCKRDIGSKWGFNPYLLFFTTKMCMNFSKYFNGVASLNRIYATYMSTVGRTYLSRP